MLLRQQSMYCSIFPTKTTKIKTCMTVHIKVIYRLRATGELARRPSLLSSFCGDLDLLRYFGLSSRVERLRRSSLSWLRSGLRPLSSRRRSRSLLRLLQHRNNVSLYLLVTTKTTSLSKTSFSNWMKNMINVNINLSVTLPPVSYTHLTLPTIYSV